MLEGVALRTFVPLLLRAGLAVVFIYHGLDKVSPEGGYGLHWGDKMPNPLPGAVQALVAWGELLGGAAIALGLLTRIAAAGIIAIMLGAIYTVHLTHGFSGPGGYEYNFALIVMALCLVLGGGGTFSLDRVIHVKMRGPARY